MWGESSNEQCEVNCQCSGLITDQFKINSGNNSTKRRREEAQTHNFKLKMNPYSIDFSTKSPSNTPKRRILGEITNSPFPASPNRTLESPITSRLLNTPKLNIVKRSSSKISRVLEERSRFKMASDKENELHVPATCLKQNMDEETRFSEPLSPVANVLQRSRTVKNWTLAKMTSESPRAKKPEPSTSRAVFGHDDDLELESEDTLHDLDAEFECDNFDQCTKYEIVSTDSPDIISRGRTDTRKISSKNFDFGAPLAETELSTSFNKPNPATRMLNFEETLEFSFTSPETLRPRANQAVSVKKSLKFFSETPTKNALRHENSNSSIGSMSASSPLSFNGTNLRLFPSESTASMESGFISEVEEPFLDIDDASSSPKVADFGELLRGEIKDGGSQSEFSLKRPLLCRSLSYNPDACKARVSLFAKAECDEKRSQKRQECARDYELSCKRRKANDGQLLMRSKAARPVLQRAFSENAASIMSALARSASDPDLIGDFSLPFALPITSGNHSDLKSISCDTLAGLIEGKFKDSVSEFQVIDCRYPYEYSGGHISCATNLYTPAQVLSLIDNKITNDDDRGEGRKIIVFHCEFSLERGPKLSRFLRSSDRAKNKENYPSLHYPEIYLLHEGYSAFYQRYPHLCTPAGYTMMLDPEFKTELSTFRRLYPTSGRRSFMM